MNWCYRVLLSSVAMRWARSIWVWLNDTLDSSAAPRIARSLHIDPRPASRALERATRASALQMAQGADPP